MALHKVIADLERELAAEREELRVVAARVAGKEAELRSLRAGLTDPGGLAGLDRTDAILTVLRRSDVSLTPAEVTSRLHAEGRDDTAKLVSSTLSYLLKEERVLRTQPKHYQAV